jgi:dTDP-4-amino-4,6-dideoxygalactose transaminase
MDAICQIARKHGLFVLEDAAQAIGAVYRGRLAGSLGDVSAFSFYPSKNLGAFGDAGMMMTDDPVLGHALARLRAHGMEPKYHHHEVGVNSRLDAIQAAVLRVKLGHLDDWTLQRREAAARYQSLFESHRLTKLVGLPVERENHVHVYNQYVIRVPGPLRDPLRDHLTSRQIGTEIYYPIPLHLQPCFASLGHKPGDFPIAEAAARETIALPLYPELTDEQQRYVVGSIRQFLDANAHGHLATTDRAA